MQNPRTLVIIVTYFPQRNLLIELASAYSQQGASVLVVDNTPAGDDGAWSYLSDLCAAIPSVRLVRCGINLGIAAALNIGIDISLREGFDYTLLSDQDSEPSRNMLSGLILVHAALAERDIRVACVAPAYFDEITGQSLSFQAASSGKCFYKTVAAQSATPWLEIITTISSGSLISRAALMQVGPMCERLFIDQVDTEWCHRARNKGFRIYATSTVRLNHRLGDDLLRIWFFGKRKINAYSPGRLYYRFRNFVLLCKLPYISVCWKLRASLYWILSMYGHIFFSSSRQENFRMILLGLWHGILRRSGPLD